jgi:hypothetical protein
MPGKPERDGISVSSPDIDRVYRKEMVPRCGKPRRLARHKNVSRTISVVAPLSTALSSRMNDETTPRILREIAEIREDRVMIIESLDRFDAALNSLSAEMRILRGQFDRLRNDVRSSQHDREGLECAHARPSAVTSERAARRV